MDDLFAQMVERLKAQHAADFSSDSVVQVKDILKEALPNVLYEQIVDVSLNQNCLNICVLKSVVASEMKQFYTYEIDQKIKKMKILDNSYKIKILVQSNK